MTWKKFLTVSAISCLIAFPQNIFSCAGGDDPYDYYVSFFWNDLSETKSYTPFYYTLLMRWYTTDESPTTEEVNVKEWKNYFGNTVNESAVRSFIYNFKHKELTALYNHIEKKSPLLVADSIKKSQLTNWFINNKDFETLGYILYAKQIEPLVNLAWNGWEPEQKDTLKMGKLIKNGLQLYNAAKKDFIKLRYGYQLVRLAQYTQRYNDCISYYEKYVEPNPVSSYLKPASLAHKAGAIFKTGRKDIAAWMYSRAFAENPAKKLNNMLSFYFCYPSGADRNTYLKLCKSNNEKANMLAMFAMNSVKNESAALKEIAALDPSSPLTEIVAAREINKAEENYFTPMLSKMKGGSLQYYWWNDSDSVTTEKKISKYQEQAKDLMRVLESVAQIKSIKNPGFYSLGAAHMAYILKDYALAEKNLDASKKAGISPKQNDQWNLTRLLVTINQQKNISPGFEEQILPQVKWLKAKAEVDERWSSFYRNLFHEILAQQYEKQGNKSYAALIADISYVQQKMNIADIIRLYELLKSNTTTAYEKHLMSDATFKADDVVNVIGTSYLRDYDYDKAIEWFKKAGNTDSLIAWNYDYITYKERKININPFHDYINDWQRYERPLPKPYTKLSFIQKLAAQEKSVDTAKTNESKAKIYYQLASAFYNMSQYGNNWMSVAFGRSSVDWNEGNYKTEWEKEFFQVHRAKAYYQKAYELSSTKEFKAAAFFLATKCAQRQIPRPSYGNQDYNTYTAQMKVFHKKFQENALFTQFKNEFGSTSFYKRAYNSCSYLQDFVKK